MNEVSLNGDSHIEAIPTIKQKALRINLNENIYGTFAEIGAGQETACLLYTSPSPRDRG